MARPDLTDWIVVNALGDLDNPNAEASFAAAAEAAPSSERLTIDARALSDARASGVTAINVTVGYTLGDAPPFEHTVADIAAWDRILERHADVLMPVRTAADIETAKRTDKVGILYGFQNTACLEERVERLDRFADLGVRVVQLTYNGPNRVGDGAMAPKNRGLSPFGREVLEKLNDLSLMVDLSHSGEQTCLDAIRRSRAPVSINHTGCRALVDLPRNKSDEELRLVADRGGFVGIYFMPFLHPEGQARAEDVVEHIVHAVDVCGADHVGIGTDGVLTEVDDLPAYRRQVARQVEQRQAAGASAQGESAGVVPFVPDLQGPDQFRRLAELLDRRGLGVGLIEKILGRNFLAYAREVWGS